MKLTEPWEEHLGEVHFLISVVTAPLPFWKVKGSKRAVRWVCAQNRLSNGEPTFKSHPLIKLTKHCLAILVTFSIRLEIPLGL